MTSKDVYVKLPPKIAISFGSKKKPPRPEAKSPPDAKKDTKRTPPKIVIPPLVSLDVLKKLDNVNQIQKKSDRSR